MNWWRLWSSVFHWSSLKLKVFPFIISSLKISYDPIRSQAFPIFLSVFKSWIFHKILSSKQSYVRLLAFLKIFFLIFLLSLSREDFINSQVYILLYQHIFIFLFHNTKSHILWNFSRSYLVETINTFLSFYTQRDQQCHKILRSEKIVLSSTMSLSWLPQFVSL